MPYLSYLEFEEISTLDITEVEFNELLPKASILLDTVTNNFYVDNNIELDNEWRVNRFRYALVSQIEYFDEVGGTSFEAINSVPQSFSAGRTSVSNPSRYKSSGSNEIKSIIAEEVYIYLRGTGLLYSGVGTI